MNKNVTGTRIKALRKEKEITLERMAEDLRALYGSKVNKGQISKWERGEIDMRLPHAIILSLYFGVSLDYICGLSTERTRK